jgi:hypothetical protein
LTTLRRIVLASFFRPTPHPPTKDQHGASNTAARSFGAALGDEPRASWQRTRCVWMMRRGSSLIFFDKTVSVGFFTAGGFKFQRSPFFRGPPVHSRPFQTLHQFAASLDNFKKLVDFAPSLYYFVVLCKCGLALVQIHKFASSTTQNQCTSGFKPHPLKSRRPHPPSPNAAKPSSASDFPAPLLPLPAPPFCGATPFGGC